MKKIIDKENFISEADLFLKGIDRPSESGIPVGTGKMASLVWITEDALHLQVNRSDVFASDGTSESFSECDSDYASGCGFADIEIHRNGRNIFGPETRQHLSVFNGILTIEAGSLKIQISALMGQDAFFISMHSDEYVPEVSIHLRSLRGGSPYYFGPVTEFHSENPWLHWDKGITYAYRNKHVAKTTVEKYKDGIALRQEFCEKEYYCQSLLTARFLTGPAFAIMPNNSEYILQADEVDQNSSGNIEILIQSSASFQKQTLEVPDLPPSDSREWWRAFWNRMPMIQLRSEDGRADRMSASIVWYMYVMACCSQGDYMARYGGLLFYTAGDFRKWGAEYWWNNQEFTYYGLVAMGCYELAEPLYRQYDRHLDAYKTAAEQQWGTKGIFINETGWFSGPEKLPDAIAEEMKELYTGRKAWEDRSAEFDAWAAGKNAHESRWNWIRTDGRGILKEAPYSYVNHIFSTTAKIAYLYWLRYRDTGNRQWLSEHAWPVLKGTAQMYQFLPFLQKDADGMIHILHVNDHENIWDSDDCICELAAMHGILPIAAKAAEILAEDCEPEEKARLLQYSKEWRELEKSLAPILTTRDEGILMPICVPGGMGKTLDDPEEEIWHAGKTHCRYGKAGTYSLCDPINLYDLWTAECRDSRMNQLAVNTYNFCRKFHFDSHTGWHIGLIDPFAYSAGKMRDKDAVEGLLTKLALNPDDGDYFEPVPGFPAVMENRLDLREGPQTQGLQNLGTVAAALFFALVSILPPAPGEEPVVHLMEGLPDEWNGAVSAHACGGFMVETEKINGRIEKISLFSQSGGSLLLHNPWETKSVLQKDESGNEKILSGTILKITGTCTLYPA